MEMKGKSHGSMQHYLNLIIMSALSFVAMYILMYAMVDKFADVYASVNQLYMAALMTAPMVVIEIIVMRGMYESRAANIAILVAGVAALGGAWLLIRYQAGVGDEQFLRSMIPHHSGAILMCDNAALSDSDIKALCARITTSQQTEIDEMRTILDRLRSK